MGYVLDYTKIKKRTMKVVFPDGNEVNILTPTKGVMDDIIDFDETLRDPEQAEKVSNANMYKICAKIINRNTENKKITEKYLTQIWDIDDVYLFYYSYADFISNLANSKN